MRHSDFQKVKKTKNKQRTAPQKFRNKRTRYSEIKSKVQKARPRRSRTVKTAHSRQVGEIGKDNKKQHVTLTIEGVKCGNDGEGAEQMASATATCNINNTGTPAMLTRNAATVHPTLLPSKFFF